MTKSNPEPNATKARHGKPLSEIETFPLHKREAGAIRLPAHGLLGQIAFGPEQLLTVLATAIHDNRFALMDLVRKTPGRVEANQLCEAMLIAEAVLVQEGVESAVEEAEIGITETQMFYLESNLPAQVPSAAEITARARKARFTKPQPLTQEQEAA